MVVETQIWDGFAALFLRKRGVCKTFARVCPRGDKLCGRDT